MTLFTATLIIAIALIAKGLIWFCFPQQVNKTYTVFLRSPITSFLFFGLASIWVLWEVAHLGEADFGEYRNWLLLLFGGVAIVSFIYLRDFLMVRGWAILSLLIAKVLLDAAFLEPPVSRLFLVVFSYFLILQALYFAAVPYRMRDIINWIFAKNSRVKQFAGGFLLYGILLLGALFTY